jgi:hypothetical protein
MAVVQLTGYRQAYDRKTMIFSPQISIVRGGIGSEDAFLQDRKAMLLGSLQVSSGDIRWEQDVTSLAQEVTAIILHGVLRLSILA